MQMKEAGTRSASPVRDGREWERHRPRSGEKNVRKVAPPMKAKIALRTIHPRVRGSLSANASPGNPPNSASAVDARTAAPTMAASERAPWGAHPGVFLAQA
jgi:hypothetical protein